MRQSIGSTWLIQLMILFILLFVGFIILTVNHSKVVRTKDEMINIVEKYEGLNSQSIQLLNYYLSSINYTIKRSCPEGSGNYGAEDLTSDSLVSTSSGGKYYYCVSKHIGAKTTHYYQLMLFYKFNLPVLGDFTTFDIIGSTNNIISKDDGAYSATVPE